MSNIQTPETGGQKPGQQQQQDEQKQTQQPKPRENDDEDEDGEAVHDKDAPGQSQAQKKKLNPDDGDKGMDAGTLGERPMTEETEAKDESEH